MALDSVTKRSIIEDYQTHKKDVGSPEVQVAILTNRILGLSEHMKLRPKDFHSRRGLIKLVSRRRKLLDYLKRVDASRYTNLITRLGLRK